MTKGVCEICGAVYFSEHISLLDWYDGPRCAQPTNLKDCDGEVILCGGLVFLTQMEVKDASNNPRS